MAKTTAKNKIPADAINHVHAALRRLGDPMLSIEMRGRFCYVAHESSPLCRLAFCGDDGPWDFAIYKYASSSYRPLDFALTRGSAFDCIEAALRAYELR